MGDSDEELLSRISAGDQSALSCFYDRHSGHLYALLRKILSRREDADDALQLAFLQIWRRAHLFDARRGSVKGWLILIARSRARDLFRSAQSVPSAEPIVDVPDPASAGDKLNQDSRLHRALNQMPVDQRSAIDLAYFGGMTYEEVAERQTLPLGTVKTRIRAGLQFLRDLMATERPNAR